jgi:hypothetical protein
VSPVIVVTNPADLLKAILAQLDFDFCRTSASCIALCTIASFQCFSRAMIGPSKNFSCPQYRL